MPAHRSLLQARMMLNLGIASLAMFFGAAIVAVILPSRRLAEPAAIPLSMWIATALVIVTSVSLHLSMKAVRRERQPEFRAWLTVAFASGLLFFVTQLWGLWQLSHLHAVRGGSSQAWIFLAVLVGLHWAHATVGLGILAWVARMAYAGRFDHEYHLGLMLVSRYWHFLDAVWLAVLGVCAFLVR